MIISIISVIICLLSAVFCFYRIGRQQAFMDLLKVYNGLCKESAKLQHTIEIVDKMIKEKIKENETSQKN